MVQALHQNWNKLHVTHPLLKLERVRAVVLSNLVVEFHWCTSVRKRYFLADLPGNVLLLVSSHDTVVTDATEALGTDYSGGPPPTISQISIRMSSARGAAFRKLC